MLPCTSASLSLLAVPVAGFLHLPSIYTCACWTSTDNTELMLIMTNPLLLQLWLLWCKIAWLVVASDEGQCLFEPGDRPGCATLSISSA